MKSKLSQTLYRKILKRDIIREAWNTSKPFPYHKKDVQRRLLKAQLSSEHDRGSRRFSDIQLHANWIDQMIIPKRSAKILDLGCGPGFYSHILAKQGHFCYGVDISSPAVNYANRIANKEKLSCEFVNGDISHIKFPENNDTVIMPYSVFNQFSVESIKKLLMKIYASLKSGGLFYFEALTFIPPTQEYTTSWYTAEKDDFFCSEPRLCLMERFWDSHSKIITDRFFIINFLNNALSQYINWLKLYSNEDYIALLDSCGFKKISFPSSPPGTFQQEDKIYISILAKKR